MSHLHLCCLDLVDERGQPGGVEYFPDADSGPADNEIAAAILARRAAIFQPDRQRRLVRSVGPSLPSGVWPDGWCGIRNTSRSRSCRVGIACRGTRSWAAAAWAAVVGARRRESRSRSRAPRASLNPSRRNRPRRRPAPRPTSRPRRSWRRSSSADQDDHLGWYGVPAPVALADSLPL